MIDEVLANLYNLAQASQQTILEFDPELLIVLANGGWAPYRALRALWDEIQPGPFPPTLVTNLGREKIARYKSVQEGLAVATSQPFVGEYDGDEELGYFLNWLTKQSDWLDQLSRQIEEVLGQDISPKRIFILDDAYFEGNTYYLTLGLLKTLYPNAKIWFMAGSGFEWRNLLAKDWLNQNSLSWVENDNNEISLALFDYIPGTMDDGKDTLSWKPIDSSNPNYQALNKYCPEVNWLELPEAIYTLIEEDIRRRVHLRETADVASSLIWRSYGFSNRLMTFKFLWEAGWITCSQVAERLGISKSKAYRMLSKLVEYGSIIPVRKSKNITYIPSPELSGRLPYKGFMQNSYWIIPQKLMIGDMPNNGVDEDTVSILKLLLDEGIDQFYFLHENGIGVEMDYQQILQQTSEQIGRLAVFSSIDLPRRFTHLVGSITPILDKVDMEVDAGKIIYIHSFIDEDVVSVVAACWLVRHGLSGNEAMKRLVDLRKNTSRYWMRAPAQSKFQRIVKNWRVGQ